MRQVTRQRRHEFEVTQPMAQLGHVYEISGFVAFLASDESGLVAVQTYAVDGGWSIWALDTQ